MKKSYISIIKILLGYLSLFFHFSIATASQLDNNSDCNQDIPINIISTDNFLYQTEMTDKKLMVITNEEIFKQISPSTSINATIDFDTQIALYARMGSQPSSGYDISITSIKDRCSHTLKSLLKIRVGQTAWP